MSCFASTYEAAGEHCADMEVFFVVAALTGILFAVFTPGFKSQERKLKALKQIDPSGQSEFYRAAKRQCNVRRWAYSLMALTLVFPPLFLVGLCLWGWATNMDKQVGPRRRALGLPEKWWKPVA